MIISPIKGDRDMARICGADFGSSMVKFVILEEDGTKTYHSTRASTSPDYPIPFSAVVWLSRQQEEKGPLQLAVTGVGASHRKADIAGIPAVHIPEFDATVRGALELGGLTEALVVSAGTGTAFLRLENGKAKHLGGSGVGGGTLRGLSDSLLKTSDMNELCDLATEGDFSRIDIRLEDVSKESDLPLPMDVTVANFGKAKKRNAKKDLALGILNTVYQTIGVMASLALGDSPCRDVVVIGGLAALPQAQELLDAVGRLCHLQFHLPEKAMFATALGAALQLCGE